MVCRVIRTIAIFVDHPSGEWLLDVDIAVRIILSALNQLGVAASEAKILVPGIGKSDLAAAMVRAGMTQLVLWDVEVDALRLQAARFSCEPRVKVEYWDALRDAHDPPPESAFESLHSEIRSREKALYDVVVDKSFMDVFLRQGHSQRVMRSVQQYLRPGGVYLAFSMFHAKWKRMLPVSQWSTAYCSIAVPRYSRTRPSVVSYSSNAAVLISRRIKEREAPTAKPSLKRKRSHDSSPSEADDRRVCITKIGEYDFVDFSSVPQQSMPLDASFF